MQQLKRRDDLIVFEEIKREPGYVGFLGQFDCHRFRHPVAIYFGSGAVVFELTPALPEIFRSIEISEACSELARAGGWKCTATERPKE